MRPLLFFFYARCVQPAQQVVFMDHLRSRMYLCPVLVAVYYNCRVVFRNVTFELDVTEHWTGRI